MAQKLSAQLPKIWICIFCLWSGLWADPGQKGISGLPSIDSLKTWEWDIPSSRTQYTLGLGLGLIAPGGAQYYTKHYVRAGFLTAFETYLLSEVLVNQPLRRQKKLDASNQSFADAIPYADSMAQYPASSRYAIWSGQFQSKISNARSNLDLIEENNGLLASQWAWLAGLHLYGLLDGYEMIQRNRIGRSTESQSMAQAIAWAAFVPGAGQFYTGHYGKAGLLYMSLIGSYFSFEARQHTVEYYEQRRATAKAENNAGLASDMQERATFFRKKRNQYIWAPLLFYFYSIGDAAVDAKMADFDNPRNFALLPFSPSGESGISLCFNF